MFDVKEVIRTAQEAAEPKTIEVDGLPYAKSGSLAVIEPPGIKTLAVNSLTAVVDYLKGQPDGDARRFIICHEDEVNVFSAPDQQFKRRVHWLTAKVDADWRARAVNSYFSQIEFVIWLQTCFFPTADRERALAVVANLKSEKVVDGSDNGLAQTIAVRAGAKSEFISIENPFLLAPFRTFPEIEPVASPFILRLQNGKENEPPQPALFAGADARWRVETRARVKAFLKDALEAVDVKDVVILG